MVAVAGSTRNDIEKRSGKPGVSRCEIFSPEDSFASQIPLAVFKPAFLMNRAIQVLC